jgi:hypothetical protein
MTAYQTKKPSPTIYFILFSLLIVLTEWMIVKSGSLGQHDLFPLAITLDLVLGLPLLFYLLVVRKSKHIEWPSVLVIYLLSVGVAKLVLPENDQMYLGYAIQLLIFTELGLMFYGIFKLRKVKMAFQTAARDRHDFILNLQTAFRQVFGNPLKPAVTELASLRYGLFFWLGGTEKAAHQQAYSLHRESGFPALMGALVFVSMIEMVAVHFLLSQYYQAVAMVLLVLSIYSVLFLLGYTFSVIKRPVLLDGQYLEIRLGLMWQTRIALDNIAKIRKVNDSETVSEDVTNLAKPILSSANLMLELKSPTKLEGLYGMQKKKSIIAFYVDEPDRLLTAIQESDQ